MGGLDPAKLLVLLVLAMVLLGPERLPKVARQVGAAWREVQSFRARVEDEVRAAIPDVDIPKIPSIPKRGLTGYITGMMGDADRASRTRGPTDDADDSDDSDDSDDLAGVGSGRGRPDRSRGRRGENASQVGWQSAPDNPSPVTAPNGVPAGWHSRGGEAPGWASGSMLSGVPSGGPEGLLTAEARLDLDDPSWN